VSEHETVSPVLSARIVFPFFIIEYKSVLSSSVKLLVFKVIVCETVVPFSKSELGEHYIDAETLFNISPISNCKNLSSTSSFV
jgi:predicted small integral membrane protein